MLKPIFVLNTIAIAALMSGCSINASKTTAFKAEVSKTQALQGFVLKGLSIEATISQGCIANEEVFQLYRDKKLIGEHKVRVLNVAGLTSGDEFTGVVYEGNRVDFYLPDMPADAVLIGDELRNKNPSCTLSY